MGSFCRWGQLGLGWGFLERGGRGMEFRVLRVTKIYSYRAEKVMNKRAGQQSSELEVGEQLAGECTNLFYAFVVVVPGAPVVFVVVVVVHSWADDAATLQQRWSCRWRWR